MNAKRLKDLLDTQKTLIASMQTEVKAQRVMEAGKIPTKGLEVAPEDYFNPKLVDVEAAFTDLKTFTEDKIVALSLKMDEVAEEIHAIIEEARDIQWICTDEGLPFT